ncbi:MAG: sulfotransferase [Alphaproteobacteria bacterium]|nr:sulfotransferase [Alphaproteobacteria bacterium]MCB9975800.1 sulfotransferase [Rhodospirillales bacterium]
MSLSLLKSFRSPEQIPHVNRILAGCLSAPQDEELENLQSITLLIGAQWSASTLIGAMLDAHPEIVMSTEFNLLRQFRMGLSLKQASRLMLYNARNFRRNGARWTGYSYSIPGQHQGAYKTLRVIGDKKAQSSALQLYEKIGLIGEMEKKFGLPVKMIHAVRSPCAAMTAMIARQNMAPDAALDAFEKTCEGVALAYRRYPGQVLLVRQEDLLCEPRHVLRRIMAFLELEASEDYLKACASVINAGMSRGAAPVRWTVEQQDRIEDLIDRHEFLNGYTPD